jgi:hypothetical protein
VIGRGTNPLLYFTKKAPWGGIVASTAQHKQDCTEAQAHCDDRYVTWKWVIGGMVVIVMSIGGLSLSFGRWGRGIETEVSACHDFRLEYQDRIDNVQANTDTLKTILRELRAR